MDDVLNLLEKIGLKKLRAGIRQEPIGRGGRERVIHIETVVKVGTPHVLKKEYAAYARFACFLKEEERRLLFPRVAFGSVSPTRALLAVEPIPGSTLEEVVLRVIEFAKRHGWKSQEVKTHQELVLRLTMKVLEKLTILHRPIRAIEKKVELAAFIRELMRGLTESVRRAGILWDLSSFCPCVKTGGAKEITVCLAHRDLGLINIMTDGEDVFFIDPRLHAVSTPGRRRGAKFASPAIDLAALLVGLEMSELEIRRIQSNFQLSAKLCVRQEIKKMLQKRQITPFLLRLSETAVWAGYAACQCSRCIDPNRAWLRRWVAAKTMRCLAQLSHLK